MNLFASLLASPWRWVALGLAILLAICFGAQGLDYASTWLARRRLSTEQTKAEAAHGRRTQATTTRQTAYQLDSTRRATEHRQRLLTDSTLAAQDAHLSTTRPARVKLPASPLPGN